VTFHRPVLDEKSNLARPYHGIRENMSREFEPGTLKSSGDKTVLCHLLVTDTNSLSSSIDCLEIGVLLLTDFLTFLSSPIKLIESKVCLPFFINIPLLKSEFLVLKHTLNEEIRW